MARRFRPVCVFLRGHPRAVISIGHGPRSLEESSAVLSVATMTSKIEARRFSGKPGTMAHYIMAVEATFAVDGILEYFNDGDGIPDNKKADWKKAQWKKTEGSNISRS